MREIFPAWKNEWSLSPYANHIVKPIHEHSMYTDSLSVDYLDYPRHFSCCLLLFQRFYLFYFPFD